MFVVQLQDNLTSVNGLLTRQFLHTFDRVSPYLLSVDGADVDSRDFAAKLASSNSICKTCVYNGNTLTA